MSQVFDQVQPAPANLKRASVRGAAATGAGQAVKFALKFGSTAILARLLTPEDFGLVAMTTVIVGFAAVFKDAGLAAATVQSEAITQAQISTLFWINAAVGSCIALLVLTLSPCVAAFYDEPRLRAVTMALAPTFLLGGFTVQHHALLRRQMRFNALAGLEVTSMLTGIVVGVTMAALGYGYWSLVGLSLGMAVANLVGVWVMVRWVPDRPGRGAEVKSLLKFGRDVLSFDVVNYFTRNADTLLIGWYWGPVSLGFYDKAYNMLLLPIRQINAPLAAVAVPTLSRARPDADQFRSLYLNTLQLVASISVPVVFAIALFAPEIVRLWLGPGWERCAVLFQLLAVAAVIGAISNPIGWLLVSLGHTQRYKQMGLFSSAVTVAAFLLGLPHGAEGVAVAYSISGLLLFLPTWIFALRGTGIRRGDVARNVLPALASCLVASASAWVCLHAIPAEPFVWVRPLAAAISFSGVYAYLLLVHYQRWTLLRGILKQFGTPSAAR